MRGENRGKGKYLRKWILIALPAAFLLAAAAVLIGNAVIKGQTAPWILTEEQAKSVQTDCILVLGAGVRDNGSPSHMLEDRLKKAIELYRAEISPKLLMSGDHGRVGYNEVGVMKRYAVREGVPESNVFMDHAGFSTYESLRRAKEVFGVQKVLIVTQGYHLYRALYIARQLGLEAYGVGADLHEDPNVPNFGTKGRGPRLCRGMVIAIEPMVNAGADGVLERPDHWTVVTKDGSLSAHYEHTLALTADGPLLLTKVD